jgi:beta-glucosidase-like glycosyl hydrolase
VCAGLERHAHRPPGGVLAAAPAILESSALGMQSAQLGMEALADRLAVAHDDRAHQRVRADPSPPTLGQLESAPHMGYVRAYELRDHGYLKLLIDESVNVSTRPPATETLR